AGDTQATLLGHVMAGFGFTLDLAGIFGAAFNLQDAVGFTFAPVVVSGELKADDINFTANLGAVTGGVNHGTLDLSLGGKLTVADPSGDGVVTLRELRAAT